MFAGRPAKEGERCFDWKPCEEGLECKPIYNNRKLYARECRKKGIVNYLYVRVALIGRGTNQPTI